MSCLRILEVSTYRKTMNRTRIDFATVKTVYYPKHSDTRTFYDKCRTANGGYGGLLSATFYTKQDAATFFDNLDTAKGPSLGTNFTLRYAQCHHPLTHTSRLT